MKFSKEVLAIAGIGFVIKMAIRRDVRRAVRPKDFEDDEDDVDDGLSDSEMDHSQMDIIPDRVVEPEPPGLVSGSGSPEDHCILDDQPILGGDEESSYCVTDPLGDPRFAPREKYSPLAPPNSRAIWPLKTKHQLRLVSSYWSKDGTMRGAWGRQFGAKRMGGGKIQWHSGVDLFSDKGDIVVAPEDATVIAILPFYHGSWAMYLLTENELVLNLGEIENKSWYEFGIKVGQKVKRGQALARSGPMEGGKTMIHFEIYDAEFRSPNEMVFGIRRGKLQWHDKENPPDELMDPSAYLVQAAVNTYRMEQAGTA